jgi:hypothetical protein
MATKVEIEIEITTTGEVHMEVKGVKGKGCLDLTKPLEAALGKVEARKLKSEYYETATAVQTRRTR